MVIGIAGPYTADTEAERKRNLDILNEAAAKLLEMGHIPLIGINAALPVAEKTKLQGEEKHKALMAISLAVINACEALLFLKESPGANMERDLITSKGLKVYTKLEDLPANSQ
jgi:hypothetical protein